MINYIKGKISSLNPAVVVVENNGIGYQLLISLQTYNKIGENREICLFIECVYVREDNPRYYGFMDEDERDLFRKIISVSGVGGSSAILMLSSHSSSDIVGAINTANVAFLKSIKGIGEKTAQRIVVDLKGKLGKHEGGISQILTPSYNKHKDEALMALVTLGFAKANAEKAIEKAIKQDGINSTDVSLLIKTALKSLS